MFNILIYISYP